MADMMKYIIKGGEKSDDPDGKLDDLADWSESLAATLAKEENIELTSQHKEVIQFLRGNYLKVGQAPNARLLLHRLERQFAKQGGRKWLYTLFPKGPISQGCKIGGLPIPSNSRDPSFGTSL